MFLQVDTFQYSCLLAADTLPLSAMDLFNISYTASLGTNGTLTMACPPTNYISLISVSCSGAVTQAYYPAPVLGSFDGRPGGLDVALVGLGPAADQTCVTHRAMLGDSTGHVLLLSKEYSSYS